MSAVRIVLADDHTLMRQGLRLVLERQPEFIIVGEASNGREAVDLAIQEVPDVIVMDISMPLLNGIEAAKRIHEERLKTAIVILSMHADEAYILRSLRAGARAYQIGRASCRERV